MNGVKENKARRSFQASSILFVVVIAVIMMLVLVPIGYMLYESCTNDMGAFTLENFARYFKRKSIRESLRNTLLVSAGIGGFGTLLGVTLAIAVATAMVGPISFLGLIIANLSRQLLRTFRHSQLVLGSTLFGMIVLVAGQLIVEHVFTYAIPVSVFITVGGGL